MRDFSAVNILLVDNYDSFTFNLRSLITKVGGTVPTLVKNDVDPLLVDLDSFDAVVISPGPGTPLRPTDIGITASVLRRRGLPTLGVCLGHQAIGREYGATVAHAPQPMHGRISTIMHDGDPLFADIPSSFKAVRYHSLAVTDLPENLISIATSEDGVVMAIRHAQQPQWGVQFHPESILTDCGESLMRNFINLAAQCRSHDLAVPRRSVAPAQLSARPAVCALQSLKLDGWAEPQTIFSSLYGESTYAFWLDSSAQTDDAGRFSYMGDVSGPAAHVVTHRVNTGSSLFETLSESLRTNEVASDDTLPFPFRLGFVGYLGYEMKAETGSTLGHEAKHADAQLLFVDRAVVFDHHEQAMWLLTLNEDEDEDAWMAKTSSVIDKCVPIGPGPLASATTTVEPFEQRRSRRDYLLDIERCQELIRNGESYEVCLTNMLRTERLDDPLRTFFALRHLSPTPHGAYFRFDELHILSSSPERFLYIDASGHVEAKPIKGTSARSSDPVIDQQLAQSLHVEKEHAENLMIVDLLRNDLSVVCEPESVRVPKLFAVESFASVHQLVSTIVGTLRPDESAVSCVRSVFPGGSMTGAPKIRTVQIIDDIETAARGIYSGILGYFSLDGAADWSMVIRTIVDSPDGAFVGVGGAITALSNPDDEYDETLLKADRVLRAIATSRGTP